MRWFISCISIISTIGTRKHQRGSWNTCPTSGFNFGFTTAPFSGVLKSSANASTDPVARLTWMHSRRACRSCIGESGQASIVTACLKWAWIDEGATPYLWGFLFIVQLKYRHIWLYASLGSKIRSDLESDHNCLIKECWGSIPTSCDEFLEINARLTNFSTICFEVAFNNTLSPERSVIMGNKSRELQNHK